MTRRGFEVKVKLWRTKCTGVSKSKIRYQNKCIRGEKLIDCAIQMIVNPFRKVVHGVFKSFGRYINKLIPTEI